MVKNILVEYGKFLNKIYMFSYINKKKIKLSLKLIICSIDLLFFLFGICFIIALFIYLLLNNNLLFFFFLSVLYKTIILYNKELCILIEEIKNANKIKWKTIK